MANHWLDIDIHQEIIDKLLGFFSFLVGSKTTQDTTTILMLKGKFDLFFNKNPQYIRFAPETFFTYQAAGGRIVKLMFASGNIEAHLTI
jgi:hypothetical protein